MKISRSRFYKPWILFATILAIFGICLLFYITMTKYLLWKSNEIQENFLDSFPKYSSNVGIVSMIKQPKNIETWLEKHRTLGIKHFYIRLEETPELEDYLESQQDVTVKVGNSAGVNEYDEIQTRQNKWVNQAYKLAELDGNNVQWLIHIDCDEILKGDLKKVQELPEDVRTFWIQNIEAKFEKVPGKEDNCFQASKFAKCGTKNSGCVSYANGKSGGRVASDVSCFGPHRMKSELEKNESIKLDDLEVEHYESCDFDIYKQKFKNLSVQDKETNIPFSYYNESIEAAKEDDDNKLQQIYEKYRVEV
jgi:hypothetical protein